MSISFLLIITRSPEFSTLVEIWGSQWWTVASSTTRSAAWLGGEPVLPSCPGTTRWTAQVRQTEMKAALKSSLPLLAPLHHLVIFMLLLPVEFDGLFISNGPGDPQLCQATINNLKKVVCVEHPKPLFGICLGHQLLSLVIGSKTYKMKLVQLWGVIKVMLSVHMKPVLSYLEQIYW